jgi:hypothetical protein
MLLVVDDSKEFHRENMKLCRSHYSFLPKRLPPAITASVNDSGASLYFNPLIPLSSFKGIEIEQGDKRRIKYGVISEANALIDLKEWSSFAFAGRSQKPVLPIIKNSDLMTEAFESNVRSALELSILLNFKTGLTNEGVSLHDLLVTICGLSYKGDIRMRFKMENKDKIANIVEGNKNLLSELYLPILIDMEAEDRVKSLENGNFRFDKDWA